jgi:excisionase family DNA binding protein
VLASNAASTSVPIPALALRPREAAAALGVSERTLWAWTAAGEVPHVRRGKTVLYPVGELTRWLAEQSTGGNREGRR